jgi:hypothetical protein
VTVGPSQLIMKTPGFLLSNITHLDVIAASDFSNFTLNGRFAWGVQSHTELVGTAIQGEVLFPQGWSVQEGTSPSGWVDRTINNNLKTGMPWGVEIHDVWTTTPFTEEDFRKFTGYYLNTQLPPAMLSAYQMIQHPGNEPYYDFEQVIACRSREWMGDTMGMDLVALLAVDATVREMPGRKTHDVQWGSGEVIASQDIYHIRIMIARVDTASNTGVPTETTFYTGTSNWFTIIPPSIQPMLTYADKPEFVEKITMERRSKNV